MTKKDDKAKDEAPEPVLGTGAAGDPTHPAEGAPVVHEQFEPDPVDAPAKVEKESSK